MRIAVIGAGRMGSAFAWHLAKAGHDVTVVARGERLTRLEKDGALETVEGDRAAIRAASSLALDVPWDGVLVTVRAQQAKPLLPTLRSSQARSIVFLFNTVESLQTLRDAVGAERCVFGFPTGFSLLIDGKLRMTFSAPGQEVTVSSEPWAQTFRAAKLRSRVEPDMESFLRSHAAMVIPLMSSGVLAFSRQGGITWAEGRRFARAMKEGAAVVRSLGHPLKPPFFAFLVRLPTFALTALLFFLNKLQVQRDLGSMGPSEVRELIDDMQALAPGRTPEMLAIRP